MIVPKMIGSDNEVGNVVVGRPQSSVTVKPTSYSSGYSYVSSTDSEAATLLKATFKGVDEAPPPPPSKRERKRMRKQRSDATYWSNDGYGNNFGSHYSYRDWGRKWLQNGGCAYIDSNHLEICTPIVRSAYDYTASLHAMLRLTRLGVAGVNAEMKAPGKVTAFLANSDGHGNSWGSHIDMLVSRGAWDDLFVNKLHYGLFLAAYQVSSIVFTGQGKVGSENKAPAVGYQLSQRADFFECMMASQTTFNRPILNTRDETLCSSSKDLARLHIIFYDWNLCHVANVLKVGVLQIILAMIEERHIDPNLILDDPLKAVRDYSHDATLKATARTAGGMELTAVDLQFKFLEAAKKFVASGKADKAIPRVGEIMALWEDTLQKLKANDWPALIGRLDWVLKQQVIARTLSKTGAGWDAPEAKRLDFLYSDLSDGLFWAYENSGLVVKLVPDEKIAQFVTSPPEDSRAWLRAEIIKRAPDIISDVDWDKVVLSIQNEKGFTDKMAVKMPQPYNFTRAQLEAKLNEHANIEDGLAALGMLTEDIYTWSRTTGTGTGAGTGMGTGSSFGGPRQYDHEHHHGAGPWNEYD